MRARGTVIASWVACALLSPGCEARIALGGNCQRNSDCEGALVCAIGGRCREACATSRDCPIGLHCVRDPAAADPAGALRVCTLEAEGCRAGECNPGLVCLEARCVNECAVGGECPDGLCQSGLCVPMPRSALDASVPADAADAPVDAAPDARDALLAPDVPVAIDAGDPVDAPFVLDAGSDVGVALDVGPDASVADGGADAATADAGTASGAPEATVAFPSPATNDYAGWSVAISGDGSRALVGQDTQATALGRAAVYVRAGTSWSLEAILAPVLPMAGDSFGRAVALDAAGDRALVGAPMDDVAAGADAGSATVFVRTGSAWTVEATLEGAAGAAGDRFGHAVALSADGTRALFGAPGDGRPGRLRTGSARVFVRMGAAWTEELALTAADAQADDGLGTSVALSADGSRALVGVGDDDTAGGMNAGSARVFARSGTSWLEEATLVALGGAANDFLGYSVALSADGGAALVGAHGDDTAGAVESGSARYYTRAGAVWTETATLLPRDALAGDGFGRSVALDSSGTSALVGAFNDDTSDAVDAGSARMFSLAAGIATERAILFASPGGTLDNMGIAVALAGDASRALVGVHRDDLAPFLDAGSALVFFVGP